MSPEVSDLGGIVILDETRNESILKAQELMFPYLTPASPEEYMEWLEGFIVNGGQPTDYPKILFKDDPFRFFRAVSNFKIVPLYTPDAVSIIIPRGIQVINEDMRGENRLFFFEGFHSLGEVPIHPDIADILLPD